MCEIICFRFFEIFFKQGYGFRMVAQIVERDRELCRYPDLRFFFEATEHILVFVRLYGLERFLIAAECFERKGQKAFEMGQIVR